MSLVQLSCRWTYCNMAVMGMVFPWKIVTIIRIHGKFGESSLINPPIVGRSKSRAPILYLDIFHSVNKRWTPKTMDSSIIYLFITVSWPPKVTLQTSVTIIWCSFHGAATTVRLKCGKTQLPSGHHLSTRCMWQQARIRYEEPVSAPLRSHIRWP